MLLEAILIRIPGHPDLALNAGCFCTVFQETSDVLTRDLPGMSTVRMLVKRVPGAIRRLYE